MHTRMRSQNSFVVEIVRVCRLSANVVLRYKKSVKTVLSFHYWVKVLKYFELFILNF